MSTLMDALTPTEETRILTPDQEWSDDYALKVVSADFQYAQNYRRYHDMRWELADRLYFGWEKQRTWEGTNIPRSSLGVFVVFQQIESLLPKILSAIFSDQPWFEVGGQPGTTVMQANAARDLLLYQMEMCRRIENQSIREVFRRCIKSGLIYGNGILELCWNDKTIPRKKHYRQAVPVTQLQQTPYGPREFPTGEQRSAILGRDENQRYQMPQAKYVSIKDFYIDPNCPGPQIQQARYAITRALLTVDEVKAKAKQDGFKIPADAVLNAMAMHKPSRQADVTKAGVEASRGNNWQPQMDTSVDPASKRIEVVSYWTPYRRVEVANPETATAHVLYNEKNDYGFIPLYNSFYTDVLDRFYGLSVTDVTEGEHRLQGGILNARMDELALTIHAARIKRRGASTPTYQLRRRPGQIIEADNPKEDIVTEKTQDITQQAYIEVQASEARVQKTTGVTDLVGFGVASVGGNSANRTARGVGAQEQAAFSRIIYLVENIEDTFVETVLTDMHRMNTMYLDPNEALRIVGKSGDREIDPLDILNADVLFYMRASSKMQARQALLQMFPMVAQTFMNPELQAAMQRQGKTFDFEELWTIFLDITGYKTRGQFVRPMTPEEQKALAQAQQTENNVELTKQRERMVAMKELQGEKLDAQLENTVMQGALKMAAEKDGPDAE